MMRSLASLVLLGVLFTAPGCAARPPAKTGPAPAPTPAPPPAADTQPPGTFPVHGNLPGGWTNQSVDDPGVKAAASQAVTLLGARDPSTKLVHLLAAQTQVVAGLNYRLVMELATAKGSRRLAVTVYRDLQNQYRLTDEQELPPR